MSTQDAPLASDAEPNLSVGRNIKIGLFHLGSGMADVIATGVWNRIMISDLGFSATPIGLLVSLRYFLAPLGVWAGRVSDQRAMFGYRRLFWIWLGRAMMVASIIALGLVTANLARGADANPMIWVELAGALFLFSLGNAISGSTFLALIYDRARPSQRGRAVGIVWTFLLLGFTIGGIMFGVLLPHNEPETALRYGGNELVSLVPMAQTVAPRELGFTPEALQNLFIIGAAVMGTLWTVSLIGEEQRSRGDLTAVPNTEQSGDGHKSTMMGDLRLVWQSRSMRFFCIYLALSMLFAFSQDLILEPFAAEVFGMPARTTSRFSAYWGSMSILATLGFLWLSRRYKFFTNANMSYLGVGVLVATFVLFGISSVAELRWLVTPGLITLGIGLGIWNVGTLGLMMDMSPLQSAGTFLGFWTLVVTLARGAGVSGGGIVRDIMLSITGADTVSYGVVFFIGAIGLAVSYWALTQAKVKSVSISKSDAQAVFAGALD
jgi:BCD family chlorophyll transporter-like MFS transporter